MMESSNIQTLERTIQLFILMGHISITTSIIFYNLNNGTKTLKHSTEKYQPLISLANTQTYQTIMIIINFRNFVQTFITSRTPTIKIVSNFWFSNHLSLFFFSINNTMNNHRLNSNSIYQNTQIRSIDLWKGTLTFRIKSACLLRDKFYCTSGSVRLTHVVNCLKNMIWQDQSWIDFSRPSSQVKPTLL